MVVVGAGHQLQAAQFLLVRQGVGAAQVARVVQQRGGDEGIRRARGRAERPGLEQVLRDVGHALSQVLKYPCGRDRTCRR